MFHLVPGYYKRPLNSTLDVTKFEQMDIDPKFYDRADAHIHLSNDQMTEVSRGKFSASMMYAAARFNAWVSACGFDSRAEMAQLKAETLEYFVAEYRKMLEENLDEYIEKFEQHMKARNAIEANGDV